MAAQRGIVRFVARPDIPRLIRTGIVTAWAVDWLATSEDRWQLKAIVGLVTSLSLTKAGLSFASNIIFAQAVKLDSTSTLLNPVQQASQGISITLDAVVQVFFAYRCFLVRLQSGSWLTGQTLPRKARPLLILVVLGILCAAVGGYGSALHPAINHDTFFQTEQSRFLFMVLTEMWLFGSAFTDLLITAILALRLHQVSRATTKGSGTVIRRRAQDWVRQLIRLSLTTAALTTSFAITAAFLYVLDENSSMFEICTPVLPCVGSTA